MSRNASVKIDFTLVGVRTLLLTVMVLLNTNVLLAAAAVTFSNGTLTVNTSETTAILSTTSTGYVTVNTVATGVLAKNVKKIKLTGNNTEGVTVDLSLMTRKTFARLTSSEIVTGQGDDDVYGSFVTDKINTGSGDDVIYCSAGNDSVDGGGDFDRLDVISQGGRFTLSNTLLRDATCRYIYLLGMETVTVDATAAPRALILDARNFTGSCEVMGSRYNDNLQTGPGSDFLVGQGGSDYIYAGNGDNTIIDDSLYPEATLTGGFGRDIIYAGSGNDQIFIHGGLRNYIDAGSGNDYIDASGALVATSITIDDDEGDDLYLCSSGDDFVYGYDGADQVFAGSGKDHINYWYSDGPLFADGEAGDDTIYGSFGDDIIYGGDGNNVIDGGPGLDLIDGVFEVAP